MNKIKFSKGWNGSWDKLRPENRRVGKSFTTARGFVNPKRVYYMGLVGKEIEMEEEGKLLGKAKLLFIDCAWAGQILIEWWRKDTHADATWEQIGELMEKFYKTTDPFLIKLHLVWTEVYE